MTIRFATYTEVNDVLEGSPVLEVPSEDASGLIGDVLDLEFDWCGRIDPGELVGGVDRALRALDQGRGADFTRPGVDEERLRDYLGWLREVAVFAREQGREVGWS